MSTAIDGDPVNGHVGVSRGVKEKSSGSERTRFVVCHKEHESLRELHGLGVFAPFVVDKEVRQQLEIDDLKGEKTGDFKWGEIDVLVGREYDDLKGRAAYERLEIFRGRGSWPKLVYDLLRREEPDEIVDASGVVRPAERLQVNQLVVAVEAAFNKLDRVLGVVEEPLATAIAAKGRAPAGAGEILKSFGPPKLKLAGGLSLADSGKFKMSKPARVDGSRTGAFIVSTLERIEQAVQLVEKTTKRVVTNRTFGLGPPSSRRPTLMHLGPKQAGDVFGPKQAGDVFGPKQAGDVFGPKQAGDVFGPKQAGDVFGPMGSETGAVLALLSSDAQVAGSAVSILFTQVAFALSQLEQAGATIEFAAAQFLFTPAYVKMLSAEEFKESVQLRFSREFGIMKEVSLQARRNIRRILAHPVYGLGPGPEGLGQEERDELAVAAGLSRRNLLLL